MITLWNQKITKCGDLLYIIYLFLAHIFFDDAYEISDACDDWQQINQFVKLFVGKYYKRMFS